MEKYNRRDFIRKSLAAGASVAAGNIILNSCSTLALKNTARPAPVADPLKSVRIGFIGVGGMGSDHVSNLLKIEGVEIRAVCDIVEKKVQRIQDWVIKAGQSKPEGYSKGEYDYKNLCAREDLDLVYIATPWEWHVPMCLEAMQNSKHAATEVPAAYTIDDCWKLIKVSEQTGKYCLMMENCNYDQIEMMILNMVKKGILGEIIHAECGYLHDLREVKYDMEGEGLWRRAHSMKRNGDLYPTHGLGPVAQCLDINRGNSFDYLVSMGTKTRGLHKYAVDRFGENSSQAQEKFVLSDVVTTLLHTVKGETVVLKHDTNLPRPYSRDILVQGTKGIVRKYPDPKIYIEGRSEPHTWEQVDPYLKEYNHPLWVQIENKIKDASEHGAMDYLEDFRLIRALLKGVAPDNDVYDAAVLSAVIELSEQSIANGSVPVKFPDFTRGMWESKRELQVMKDEA
jgi:predicted dehydrogenase